MFDRVEAIAAVRSRAHSRGLSITDLEAEQVATALGNDPLLIAVASSQVAPVRSSVQVISEFVRGEVEQCAAAFPDGPIGPEYFAALGELAFEMMRRRNLEPSWNHIADWIVNRPTTLSCLRQLVQRRLLCHVHGTIGSAQFSFRHDRVRSTILANCVHRRLPTELPDEILNDPYYAEIVGLGLVFDTPSLRLIERVKTAIPYDDSANNVVIGAHHSRCVSQLMIAATSSFKME
jgi:hypothetical protein